MKKSKRKINEIIVHCTATPQGKNFTVEDIDRWHKERGWKGIGYHYVVYLDGTVHEGRDVDVMGAHCTGHNKNSIGVVYIGGLDASGKKAFDSRTTEQRISLMNTIKELKSLYPNATVHGHNEFAAKACPSFNAREEYKNL